MTSFDILAPLLLVAFGLGAYALMRREGRRLDREHGPDPK